MSRKVFNIPKDTIRKAVMGNGSYKVSRTRKSIEEPRDKSRYYYTKDRLTRAQILVLLEMHEQINSEGYAMEIYIRDLAAQTHLTMQCVNRCIRILEKKGFIVVILKDYGYVNFFINIEQGYKDEGNTGGYYQMDGELLGHLLSLKRIDDLRLALVGLLEDDFARIKVQSATLPLASIRRILPGRVHPKVLNEVIKTEDNSPYHYERVKGGVKFTLKDEYYGKYITSLLAKKGESLVRELGKDGISLTKKNEKDIISLCQEFDDNSVRFAIYSLSKKELASKIPLGAILRGILVNVMNKEAC